MPLEVLIRGGLDVVAWCFLMTAVEGVDISLQGITSEGGIVVAPEVGGKGEKGQKAPLEMTLVAPLDGTLVRLELGEGKRNLEMGLGVPCNKERHWGM